MKVDTATNGIAAPPAQVPDRIREAEEAARKRAERDQQIAALDSQIAALDGEPYLEPLPKIGTAARLYANPATHRMFPAGVGFAAAKARSRAFWRRSEGGREDLMRSMEYIVGRSSRAGEVEELARRHSYETAKRSEYLWRPWLTSRLAVEGAAEAVAFQERVGGVMVTFMHHGPYVGLPCAVKNAGMPHYAPINPFFFESPHPGFRGHRDRRHMRSLMDGARCFSAGGSVPTMLRILERGQVLGLAIDVPGKTDATFLGREVKMASGAAMLAFKSQVPVIPLTMHRGRGRTLGVVRFGSPIMSSEFSDPNSLHAEIVRRHEPAILDWPEALEWPLERWAPADPGEAERFGFTS